MIKTENRPVDVKYCDICEEETEHFDICAVCKREMCNKEGGAAHSTHSIKLYRYNDGIHLGHNFKICEDCAGMKFEGTIQEFFDGMFEKGIPVAVEA